MGLGNSTIVGIGGDPVVGSSFIDILAKFEADPETEVVVMVGEIGGDEEEKAARFIEAEMSKPVVAYIAGFTAPPGKTMGHAGAIISGSSGTAQAKKEALEAAGSGSGRRRPRSRSSRPRRPAPRPSVDAHSDPRPGAVVRRLQPRAPLRGAERPAAGRGRRSGPPRRSGSSSCARRASRPPRGRHGLDAERIAARRRVRIGSTFRRAGCTSSTGAAGRPSAALSSAWSARPRA